MLILDQSLRRYFPIYKFLSFFFLFRTLSSTAEFNYGSISFDPVAIFNILWVTNYVDITQNAANNRLQILGVDKWWYTDELQTLFSAVLVLAMKTPLKWSNAF